MSRERSADSAEHAPDRGPAWLLIMATGVLVLFHYLLRADLLGTARPGGEWTAMSGPPRTLLVHNLGAFLTLAVLPLVHARFLEKIPLGELGLGRGVPRRVIAWVAVGVPIAVVLGWASAGHPDVRAVYPLGPDPTGPGKPFLVRAAVQFLYYASWEVLFRGVLLRGLSPRFGFAGANAVQTALSVVAHFGRPLSETFAALPAGLAFGGVARHTGSIWPVIIIHWCAGMAQDWFLLH